MRRNISLSARAPSPTNTAFSGISSYRSEQYKPLREKGRSPSIPQMDPRAVAKLHYDEIASYLEGNLAKEPANARASAREKLTRLTKQQFQELSTDVYDELLRRKNNTSNQEVPFLPVRDDFHPKRNQARQKLATLPKLKFKDLSGDVFHELGRRHPEFREPELLEQPSPSSNYDDMDFPSPDFPQASRIRTSLRNTPVTDSGYAGSSTTRRPSEESYRRRPSEELYTNRSEDNGYGSGRRPSEDGYPRDGLSGSSRRKPSQDTVTNLKNEDRRRMSPDLINSSRRTPDNNERELVRKPSSSASTLSDSANLGNAQREMIVPAKSTIAEEDIEVPYGRGTESRNGALNDRISRNSDIRDRSPDAQPPVAAEFSDVDSSNARSPPVEIGGLNGLSARLRDRSLEDDEDEDRWSAQGKSGEEYYDKMSFGRASVASDRSLNLMAGSRMSGSGNLGRLSKAGMADDLESVRREYEFKIATLQNRLTGVERELEDVEEREKRLEGELKRLQNFEDQESVILNLNRELNELREELGLQMDLHNKRTEEDEREIKSLRSRCELLQSERRNAPDEVDSDTVDQLRSDLEGLVAELEELSKRNDELLTAKDSDVAVIQNLDAQLKDYKRKYENAKTELRGLKATSQLSLQPPKMDSDQLPITVDGGILDNHLTTFVSTIDNLLAAGRSHTPRRVLAPMMAVVNAVTAITDDLRLYERTHVQSDISGDIQVLRERCEATLSNLVAVANTHATSMGMAPVSLLDAAASHLSATVTEIGRTVFIRKTTVSTIDENKSSPHQRSTSSSSRRLDEYYYQSTNQVTEFPKAAIRGVQSPHSRPIVETSPVAQLQVGTSSVDVLAPEGTEDAWSELKPYLEAQSESIVYAIQSVLSGVRSPNPAPSLAENLTQIITIVSSIVAVCKDSLPTGSLPEGQEILRELSEHATKLSEVQSQSEVTKEARQVMAKSSFAVANAMKSLMKL